jgi:uncharacterized protein YkwD
MRSEIGRRRFLQQASWSMLALPVSAIARHGIVTKVPFGENLAPLPNQLLNLVNEERTAAGLTVLKLDELACKVAEKHAIEMAEGDFLSHWGRDGRKPYHRYSFAGGTEAIEENDGAADHGAPVASEEFTSDLIGLHKAMFDEFPPNDGHRQTILAPQHTHVGFGVALRGNHVRLSELYVARYVAIDEYSVRGVPKSKFFLSGRLLDPAYSLTSIDVFYEPLPSPPELPWLQTPRSYSLPDDRETLLIKLPENTFYETGSRGSIEIHGRGRFRAPINLTRKQPGIYTVVVWIQKSGMGKPFPATQVCVRAE